MRDRDIWYKKYIERDLYGLWIRPSIIYPLISKLENKLQITSLGLSEEDRPIYNIEIGHGPLRILMWSQMHGDESTATKSIFDLLNFLLANENESGIQILEACTIHIIPMLNPDGAERYTRENALGIDLNRDAVDLATKEAQILHTRLKELKPDFAFNLHDQTSYYSVSGSDKVASMSFLSPAADRGKTLTESRVEAMKVIVAMKEALDTFIPGHLGRYDDTYCDNCFGDYVQSLDIPTILIESGHILGDKEREQIRKYHFIVLVSALEKISKQELRDPDKYFEIPLNNKNYYDLKIMDIIFKNSLTNMGIRYENVLENGKIIKKIVEDDIISGEKLNSMCFHSEINVKKIEYKTFLKRFINLQG